MVLSSILSFLLKLSGIIEKFLNATIILGIPSKIIGAILGFIEALVFSFIVLFVMLQFSSTHSLVTNSTLAKNIIDKTPLIGTMVDDSYKAINDIIKLEEKYKNTDDIDMYNCEILNIMLNYKLITPEVAEKLVDENKLEFNGVMSIIDSYKEDNGD